jgi:hypothetical protein
MFFSVDRTDRAFPRSFSSGTFRLVRCRGGMIVSRRVSRRGCSFSRLDGGLGCVSACGGVVGVGVSSRNGVSAMRTAVAAGNGATEGLKGSARGASRSPNPPKNHPAPPGARNSCKTAGKLVMPTEFVAQNGSTGKQCVLIEGKGK